MELKELLKVYREYCDDMLTDELIGFLMGWDAETESPRECFESRGRAYEIIAERNYKTSQKEEYKNAIKVLSERIDEIDDPVLRFEIIKEKRANDRNAKVPQDWFVRSSRVMSQSSNQWAMAKQANDFSMFCDTLQQIIDLAKERISYIEEDGMKGYDVLLDRFEMDMRKEVYDEFFNTLKRDLIPFVKEYIKTPKPTPAFAKKTYPANKQREFCEYIMTMMNYNRQRGLMKESEHPFTSGYNKFDTRVTVHYYPKLFTSSIFSAIHELGHATYEQQCDDSLTYTLSKGGASLALHESQSRFYENILGRSKEFWDTHFDALQKVYPRQLKGVTADDMYRYVNQAKASFIRTEADELTYPIHIMLRYDIEKEIIDGNLKAKDIPARWNELFYEYFGLKVPDDRSGALQDIHWSIGSIGYFPTYALGSAYSAQIFDAMNKDFNVLDSLKSGTTVEINKWLENKIHRFGSSKKPIEIFENAVGGKFDPSFYVKYLIGKYSNL